MRLCVCVRVIMNKIGSFFLRDIGADRLHKHSAYAHLRHIFIWIIIVCHREIGRQIFNSAYLHAAALWRGPSLVKQANRRHYIRHLKLCIVLTQRMYGSGIILLPVLPRNYFPAHACPSTCPQLIIL